MASDTCKTKRKATDNGNDPEYVDYPLIYNYMKQMEIKMDAMKAENKALHERLDLIENSLTTAITSAIRKELANYFDGPRVPIRSGSPSPSTEAMEEEATSTQQGKLYSAVAASTNQAPKQASLQSEHRSIPTTHFHQHPLNPKTSVVIYNIQDKEKFTKDTIRFSVNSVLGPTLIVSINKYGWETTEPKYMLQLKKEADAKTLLEKWKPDALHNTKVRATRTPEKHVGMLSNVPTSFSDLTMQQDIQAKYPGAACNRIVKKDTPTRTVKIVFTDEQSLEECLEHGISLNSYSSIWMVEKPRYSSFKPPTA